ncbi:hypothetical protein [Flavobacterium hungaricum]|uniref:Redox-active disulfide protein 2 n=1 Tax=Flavobacterium hungaricum TaxID=2082725 RepID=A0ABR9TKF2_9FLAO|nr:hypothetical protein [Flavobacterium hungaricum]MBE8725825.1 hypothetical protein [Flavobacterium hungaricum]
MSKTVSELTTEQLIKRKQLLKGVLIGSAIVWFSLIGAIFFLLIKKSNSFLPGMIPVFALPVVLMPLFIHLGQLSKEIKSRKEN